MKTRTIIIGVAVCLCLTGCEQEQEEKSFHDTLAEIMTETFHTTAEEMGWDTEREDELETHSAALEAAIEEAQSQPSIKLKYGTLQSATVNEVNGKNTLVVKAKITSSYSNSATVDQNYMNVFDLVQNQGCDKYDEIQYWAVADMSSGNEEKVVSFTVNKSLIGKIKDGSIVDTQLGDYASDLFIHSSLQ